jgi:hypothetical protein
MRVEPRVHGPLPVLHVPAATWPYPRDSLVLPGLVPGYAGCSGRGMEHRWGTRQPGRQRGHLHCADGVVAAATIVNVSVSGALLRSTPQPALFARVRLKLISFPRLASIEAQVVRLTQEGCAIEWRTLADPNVMSLLQQDAQSVGASLDERPAKQERRQ